MALITTRQLCTRLGADLDEYVALDAIEMASADVVGFTGQNFELADYVHVLPVSPSHTPHVWPAAAPAWPGLVGRVTLPQRPVQAVESVTIAGSVCDPDGWAWDGASPEVHILGVVDGTATVTYTAGYDPIPAPIQSVALSIACAVVRNPAGEESERYGDYAVTHKPGGPGLSTMQQRILRRYRGAAGTVRPQ